MVRGLVRYIWDTRNDDHHGYVKLTTGLHIGQREERRKEWHGDKLCPKRTSAADDSNLCTCVRKTALRLKMNPLSALVPFQTNDLAPDRPKPQGLPRVGSQGADGSAEAGGA